jgi:four helix bundle protein
MVSFAYRKLNVYQKALLWVLDVYRLCKFFPDVERFALTTQVRRAAVSVTSNIAEGMSRSSNKEVAHFLEISFGSLMEVQSQMEIAQLLNYITKDQLDLLDEKTVEIAKMLSGLKAAQKL